MTFLSVESDILQWAHLGLAALPGQSAEDKVEFVANVLGIAGFAMSLGLLGVGVLYRRGTRRTATHGEYGAQFWTNGGNESSRPDPDVPADAFKASGYQGQLVYIVPSRNAVIVRLGMTHDRAAWDANAFTAAVLAALPQ